MAFLTRRGRHIASAMIDHRRAVLDAAVIGGALAAAFWAVERFDLFGMLDTVVRNRHESLLDEVIIVCMLVGTLGVVGLLAFSLRRMADQEREIRLRHQAEDRASRLALADALTGLPNRRQFESRLLTAAARFATDDSCIAVMMIDLDRFKPVNDVFGHGVGDQVLIAFAKRAGAVAGANATLARFGGDEFALLLGQVGDTDEAARVARRLLALFDRPFEVNGTLVTLGASIGITLAPQDGTTAEDLMRRADIALYRAKSAGRGTFRFFEKEMDAQVKRRAQIERDLRLAIETGTVRPFYQPIVDLETGRITGFEALPRWSHPEFGALAPEQFIGVAEDGGLIIPLSAHLLRIAARDAVQWPSDVRLCFNLSRVQFADPMMVLRILQILGETGLSPTRLEVEISEQALVYDVAATREALKAFHSAGVRIALDEFGTGNSSLHHLRVCHFDRIKIDRTFVTSMTGFDENTSLVNAMLGLSKALGLPVTAEGIENEAPIEMLRDGGCREGQGHRFSEAVPPEEALRLLAENAAAAA
jgi:diguanylate cyclase (GGDEF)-like protein